MTRILRRTSIMAIAAGLLVGSLGVAESPAGTAAKTCKVDGFKITKRKHVTCRKAKKVTHKKVTGQKLPDGWKCSSGSGVIPEGKCKHAPNKSFHYGM